MKNLLILGAGSHGKVVAESAELEGKWDEISFLDDRDDMKNIGEFKIVGKINDYKDLLKDYKYAFVAIGNNEKRLELINKLIRVGFNVPVIIHPRACVSRYSEIASGSVVLAGAIVNVNTTIGKGCIININSCVDHDSEVSSGVHVSSGAVVRSMVKIGELSIIGAGACVKSGSILNEKTTLTEGKVV